LQSPTQFRDQDIDDMLANPYIANASELETPAPGISSGKHELSSKRKHEKEALQNYTQIGTTVQKRDPDVNKKGNPEVLKLEPVFGGKNQEKKEGKQRKENPKEKERRVQNEEKEEKQDAINKFKIVFKLYVLNIIKWNWIFIKI